jgi:hypothetical protein
VACFISRTAQKLLEKRNNRLETSAADDIDQQLSSVRKFDHELTALRQLMNKEIEVYFEFNIDSSCEKFGYQKC